MVNALGDSALPNSSTAAAAEALANALMGNTNIPNLSELFGQFGVPVSALAAPTQDGDTPAITATTATQDTASMITASPSAAVSTLAPVPTSAFAASAAAPVQVSIPAQAIQSTPAPTKTEPNDTKPASQNQEEDKTSQGGAKQEDGSNSSSQVALPDPVAIGNAIDMALYDINGGLSKEYKSKFRSLAFNLKDPHNPDLRRLVLLVS